MKKRELAHQLRKQLLSNLADMICADIESNVSSIIDSTDDAIIEMMAACPNCGAAPPASLLDSVRESVGNGDEFQTVIDGVKSDCECRKRSRSEGASSLDDPPF